MTFDEIAATYATKLKSKLGTSTGIKTAAVSQSLFQQVKVVLDEISVDLDRWTVDDKPLTKEQRERILRIAADKIGITDADPLIGGVGQVKASSNDAQMRLVTHINNLINQNKK